MSAWAAIAQISDVLGTVRGKSFDDPDLALALERIAGIVAQQAAPRPADEHRFWAGEAKAAYDQSVVEAGQHEGFPSPDFWVARAQAAAAIEAAEQARIGNLIAWKQLQTAREARGIDALPAAADEIDQQIEEGLGIA
jgi:hypothetical protein